MAVIALGNQLAIDARLGDCAFDPLVGLVVNLYLVVAAHDPIAFLEIDDPLGQRGKGQRVRTEIGLPLPDADNQWRSQPRADQQIRLAAAQDSERERPAQLWQHVANRVNWIGAGLRSEEHTSELQSLM